MALELSQLVFTANTDGLKDAIGTMQQVKAAIGSLEQAQAKASTQSSKASKAASDAAKAEAQAALAAIKLEKEKQKAIEASADATVSAGNRSISVLEKQEQVLNFMVQGYSRGQSSILATAKAAGAATDELAKLGSTLQSQRTLMGSDPFDKSLGALRALKNEFSVVKEQVRLYNAELGLTKKQSEDLARDKLRLIEASKIEGKSLFSVRDSVKELNMEYIRLAKSENDLVAQYKQNVKNTQDSAKANTYLETELQKVRFAVDEQNAALNRGSANAIVRFENALKKSGKTVAEQKVLLDEYRKSLDKLQGAGAGRATDYISRAVGPQLTDIIVGLSTGQSLMTVMMQQGGQLRDQFGQMGVAGAEMGMVMRTALSTMAVSVKDTAVAFGQLFVGGAMDAGKGVVSFATELLKLDKVLDWNKRRLAALGEEGFTAIGNLGRIATLVNTTVGVALGATVTSLVMLAVEFVRSTKAQDEFVRANASLGGQLGMTTEQAFAFAESFNKVETNGRKALDALTLFTKAGVSGSDSLRQYISSTLELNKYVGESIDDVAKKYAELEDAPLKALVEIAKKTGFVSTAVLENVAALEREGETAKAAALAKDAYMEANIKKTESAKESLSGMSLLWIDIKSGIDKAWAAMHGMLSDTAIVNTFRTAWETVAVIVSDVWYVLKQTGKEIGGIGAQIAAVMSGDFAAAKSIGEMMKADAATARAEQDKYTASILNRNKETEKSIGLSAEERKAQSQAASILEAKNKLFEKTEDSLDKQLKKTQTLSQWQATYLDKTVEKLAQQSKVNKDQIVLNDKELQQVKELAKVEWDRAHKKDGAKTNKEMDTYLDTLNKIRGISGSYNNDLKDLQSLRQKGLITEQEYVKAVEDLIAVQPFAVAQEKQRSDGLELINKLLGKGEGLGKDYYDSMEKLEKLKGMPNMDVKEIEAAQKALQATTPFAKAMSEWFAKATEAVAKSNIETKLQLANIQAQNMELDHNLAMVGLSEEAQKRLTTEFTKQRDLMKANAEYEKIRSDIMKDGSYGTDENRNKALDNAASVYKATLAQINRKAVDDLFTYYTSKAAEAGKNSFGSLSDVLKQAGQLTFATAVNSLGELIDNFDTLTAKQELYNKARAEAQGDTSKLQKLDKAHAILQVKSYGDIAKSMKGFFKEGTTGYKVMGAAEKAFRVYEMAMAVKNNAFKLAAMWGEVKTFVATTAKMIAGVTAEESAKTATRVPGIFAAFMSTMGPWGIPAAIAAMAAVGIAASGSSAPAVVTNQGTGTVFGDSSAKSETISNSLGVLEDVNTLTMRYSAEMLKSLRSIENSLTGVTNIILRSNGMESTAAGIVEGTTVSNGSLALAGIGGIIKNMPIIGKLLNSLFGTKTTITGQGIMVQDAKYQDILAGGVEAGYYTDVNRKRKFLGITTSDKNSTNYKADKELSDQFGKLLNGFVDTIKAAAPVLGISLDTIDNNLKDFVLKIGKIDLKDLKGDEIKEKLMSVFGAAGDDLARQAMAGFEKYQQVGEGYLETIVRLASTVESVRGSLDTLNSTFVLSVDNAMALVDAFGDLDKLTTAMSDYNQSYYTEAERNATLQRQLTREFTAQNLKLPTTKDEYRKLVEAQDLNTEAGRKMYAFLLTLAPAFSEIADAAEAAAEDAAESAAALEQAWKDAASTAYNVLEKAIQAQISILNEQATASEATISKLKGIFDLLKSSISDLYGEVSSTAAMQASQGYQVISSAISTGNLPAQSDLSSAISAVRSGISGTDFVSQFEADKARLQFAADLNTLLGQTEQQLSTEELTLKAIKDQIAMLELTLANAKAQLDAINGVNSSVLSVADAIRAFQEALIPTAGTGTSTTPVTNPSGGSFSSGPGTPSSGGYSVIDEIKNFYNQTLDPEQLKMQMWLRGWSIEDMATAADVSVDWASSYLGIPAFATGGDYKGGLALVGEEGPEMINFNQGGRVYNATQTSSMLSGGTDTVSAIQSLETRVDNLNYALQAIAINTSKTARVLERVTPDGDSILITDAATLP